MSTNKEVKNTESDVVYIQDLNEYKIIVNGRTVGWATYQGDAYRMLAEQLRIRREHARRCPEDRDFGKPDPNRPLYSDDGVGLAPGVDY